MLSSLGVLFLFDLFLIVFKERPWSLGSPGWSLT